MTGIKDNGFVKKISIALALIALGSCLFIWGQISGLEKGYFYGVFFDPPRTGFSGDGPNFYQVNNQWYSLLTAVFCVYLFGKLLKSPLISGIICLLSLSLAIFPFRSTLLFKNEVMAVDGKFPYAYWLNISVYFDWFLISAAVILISLQAALVMSIKINRD